MIGAGRGNMGEQGTSLQGKRPVSLHVKVSALIIVPMLFILILSTAIAYVQQRDRALASMSVLASQTGSVIQHVLQRDMLLSDFESIQLTFDAIGQDDRIRTLYLLDTNGKVVFAPNRDGVGRQLDYHDETCQPCHRLPPALRPSGVVVTVGEGQPVFRSMHPIENQPQCYGCHDPAKRINGLLLTDLSIAPVESALAADLRHNLTWWVGTVLVTGLLANLAVHRMVLRRLSGLASAMADMGRKGLAVRLAERPADEIGRLSTSFNTMTERIQQREIENQELSDALKRRSEERGELLERLISTQEEERKRVARELHDELGQGLSSAALTIEVAQRAMEHDPVNASRHLEQAHEIIAAATDRMYDLIMGLRPSVLDDLGLAAALRSHAERALEPAGISFKMEVSAASDRLSPATETALFRIFQEAITNVLRHARASQVVLRIAVVDGLVEAEVEDNGIGFEHARWGDDGGPRGLGLLGMRERTQQLGGRIEIHSQPGLGTKLLIRIPANRVPDD
jgi:signal transduction histidine kinase